MVQDSVAKGKTTAIIAYFTIIGSLIAITMNIKQLVSGDKAYWEDFVRSFSPVIYSAVLKAFHCYMKDVNDWDVKEAVQNIFIRLIKDDYHLLKSYNLSKASLGTWLTVVARSTTIDFLRCRRPQTIPLDEEIATLNTCEHNSSDSSIELPPDLLSPRQKIILHFIFEKDLNNSEIAEILHIDIQTVRSTKHNALNKLRKFFKVTKDKD